jgi:hypothetical protein
VRGWFLRSSKGCLGLPHKVVLLSHFVSLVVIDLYTVFSLAGPGNGPSLGGVLSLSTAVIIPTNDSNSICSRLLGVY